MKNHVLNPHRSLAGCLTRLKRNKAHVYAWLLIGLLGGSAQAQLLHRYDFATDGSADDTVGTANGVIYGGATVSGGVLNTPSGVTGTLSGGVPQNCVGLPAAAVAGITNAFSIEIWYQAAYNGGFCTLFAFSDGTTNNYLQGTPARGAAPYQSDIELRLTNGTAQLANGIYSDDNTLHHVIATYDGTNITYYRDGSLPSFSGLQNTFVDTGLILSNLTYIGVGGGSPWGDQTIAGQTYDFRIYGQALNAGQVSTLFTLGSDASNAAIIAALVPPTSFTWNGSGANNNWSTSLNWAGGTAPAVSGNSLNFAGSTRTAPNVDANYSITGLTFSNNASSFTIGSDNSSSLTLAGNLLNNSANAQTLSLPLTVDIASTFTTTTNLTLSGGLSGLGSVTKTGNGVLQLSTANTFSGQTTIAGGAVKLSDANALQNSTVVINAANGLTFSNSIGTFNVGGLNGTNTTALVDSSSAAVTLSVGANNAGTTYSGILTGAGSLAKVGTGTLVLNGASTYSGGTTVSAGILAAQNAVAPGMISPFGAGSVTVNNGSVLELGYAPNNAFGSYSISNNVVLDGGSLYAFDASHRVTGNLTIGAGGASVGSTFDAPWETLVEANFPKALFFDGLLTGTGNLTVQHTGWAGGNAWNTSCAVFGSQGTAAQNTYSGAVTVNPMVAGNGGSYLYVAGTNVFANATISLTGDNNATTGRMGIASLLFGNGTVDGPGYLTLGGLAGGGSVLLADTILFSGGAGYSTGAPVALTVGNNNSTTTYSGVMSGAGSLIKVGSGTMTLSGANTYTGNTTLNGGSLILSGGWLASSNISVATGKTLDVSALSPIILAGNQTLLNGGTVIGSVNTSAGSKIYGGADGAYGTNVITGDLTFATGALAYFDVGTVAAGTNDRVTVGGTLTANGNVIHIKAPSPSASLQATDYVLFTSVNPISGSFFGVPSWDVQPANAGNFTIVTGTNTVKLHYTASSGPSGGATAAPATAARNQKVFITVTATNGNPGSVNAVTVDASSIGGSATLALVSAGGNVWTNSVIVTPDTTAGTKTLVTVISDSASLSGIVNLALPVVLGNDVWNGAGADDNFSSNLNWTNQTAPGYAGDSLTLAGTTRLTPSVDNNYTFTGIAFNSGAGAFNVASGNGSDLTVTANGIVNNSASAQTLNLPITLSTAQTINAAAGNVALTQGVTKGGNLFTVNGAANTLISGAVVGGGSLFKKGAGSLTVSDSSTWDAAQATSGGFSGPLIAQSGTVKFNNGSVQTVTGELVIGGVITNGGPGNNAKVVVDGATLNVSSWFSVGRGNGVGGVSSDLVLTNGASVTSANFSAGYNGGSTNLPKGSVTLNNGSTLTDSGVMNFGESSGSDFLMNVNDTSIVNITGAMYVGMNGSGKGVVNINGGTVSVGSLGIGQGNNNVASAKGTVTVNSGSLNSEGDLMIGFAGSGANGHFGKLFINGGTVKVATATKRWFIMSQWDTASSQVDVNGGTLQLSANTDIRFAISGNTGTNVFNLNSGAVTFYSDNATTVGGTGVVDLHQGTGTTVRNTFNLNGGTLTVFGIVSANTSGNRTLNFNGGTLKAVADNASFVSLNSGSATANIRSGGAIIDTAGFNVTIPQALLNNGVDQDGGLTKNGNGTLTLNGSNTYTNNTTVNAGTLALALPTLSSNSTVTVASGATLQLGFAVTNQVKALVLNGVSQAPGVYNATTSPTFITGTGSLVVPSSINPNAPRLQVSIAGNQLTLAWPTNAGWILQSNSVGLVNGSAWFNYPANGAVNVTTVNITMDPAKTNVFYRMVKP
jgi:autotransporter-associated beta strand protein